MHELSNHMIICDIQSQLHSQCELQVYKRRTDGTEVILFQLHLSSKPNLTKPSDHSFLADLFGNLFGQSLVKRSAVNAMPWWSKLVKFLFNDFVLFLCCCSLPTLPTSLFFLILECGSYFGQGSD